jgi:hypothetical protein
LQDEDDRATSLREEPVVEVRQALVRLRQARIALVLRKPERLARVAVREPGLLPRNDAQLDQKPNRTFVKYQYAEVLQSVISTAKSVPPTSGSVQRGCSRSCTKNTFTAKMP